MYQKYTFESIERKKNESRMEVVAYCDKILINLLYFFMKRYKRRIQLRKFGWLKTTHRQIKSHLKFDANIFKVKNIRKIGWSVNS